MLDIRDKDMRVMVDMSVKLLHHGHIRLLKKAHAIGHVVVGLTSDEDLQTTKDIETELDFSQRKELLEAIRFVDEVVETPWLITEEILDKYNINFLVHGDDNQNPLPPDKLILFPRTEGISSTGIREDSFKNKKA